MANFLNCVRKAVDSEFSNKRVSRAQRFKVLTYCILPRTGQCIQELMELEMSEELAEMAGVVSAQGFIDWENFDPAKFAAFVETLLKLIEGISKLFPSS